MAELHFKRTGETLIVTFAEQQAVVPWADVALHEQTAQRIYEDAGAYGRTLFEQVIRDEGLRSALLTLPANERLALHMHDPEVTLIPWEYLRDPNDLLLAARLNLVRYVEGPQRPLPDIRQALSIVAVPVSPVDEMRPLDTEREWRHLSDAVTASQKALSLRRVRPPTLAQMEQTLPGEGISIVHFMGHSGIVQGKSVLAFEDLRGRSQSIDASYFASALDEQVFLVVLNSCLSAVAITTEFGNIARAVVQQGVPYALGMQFVLLDDAALAMSTTLYQHLLQGRNVEEAVRRTRRALEHNTLLHHPKWIAGIPVLYTNQREPAPAIQLQTGKPIISPDPLQLQATCDLTALPQAQHFVGRSQEISNALEVLLKPAARGFVLLHGLGGIGKTALSYTIAERASWSYRDRVLAISFETFVTQESEKPFVVSETFADRFYTRLARFYGLDPSKYPETRDLQDAILQHRVRSRSLLVLDNMETLIEAQKQGDPIARTVATFLSRLQEGDGAILLTSRSEPPADWGSCISIPIAGLSEEASAEMFLTLLPADRRPSASREARLTLAERVQGHPLSLRLLAGRFAEAMGDLETFLNQIEEELKHAEQTTPSSLEDPERQRTLYACMDYSVARLADEQKQALHACSLFLAPFLPDFVKLVLEDETDQMPLLLQQFVRLGLLEHKTRIFPEGSAELLEMHPMLRWYIRNRFAEVPTEWRQQYGSIYEQLARQADQFEGGFDQSAWMRFLLRQSLPDCEAALGYLASPDRSSLAYHLAKRYERMGQNRRALALYELALALNQVVGDISSIAETQHAIATILSHQGKPQEAFALYQKILYTVDESVNIQGIAMTKFAMANVLHQQSKPQEALSLYQEALQVYKEVSNVRGIAVTQHAMAGVLHQQGKLQEALTLYQEVLHTVKELDDVRGIAVTQHAMAGVLRQQGKLQEALTLYQEVLLTDEELDDVRGSAMTQHAMADVLRRQGKLQEAFTLYQEALHTKKDLGDVREVAATQHGMADVLRQQGKLQEAIPLYQEALRTDKDLGDVRGSAITEANLAQLLFRQGEHNQGLSFAWDAYIKLQKSGHPRDEQKMQNILVLMKSENASQFNHSWEQQIKKEQPDWLRNMQKATSLLQRSLSSEQRHVVVVYTIVAMTEIPDTRAIYYKILSEGLKEAKDGNLTLEVDLFTSILSLIDGQPVVLPPDHPYAEDLAEVERGLIAAQSSETPPHTIEISEDVIQVVRDFLTAENWEGTRHVLIQQQTHLFQPEIEEFLQYQIALAESAGEHQTAEMLLLHLDLLQDAKTEGIERAFANLAQKMTPPFDIELVARSHVALYGEPTERMAHMHYLTTLATQTTDEGTQKLIEAIQLALLGGDPYQVGLDLYGVYRQAWEAIIGQKDAETSDDEPR